MAPIPTSLEIPIAFRTGESSTDPEWQAAPVEAATPSNRDNISPPAFPTKLTLRVFGRR